MRYKKVGGFDIRSADTASVMGRWIEGVNLERTGEAAEGPLGSEHSRANAYFRRGLELYQAGNPEKALAEWRKGVELNPDNYIIRKQIWAVENPEKFYLGQRSTSIGKKSSSHWGYNRYFWQASVGGASPRLHPHPALL